MGQVCKKHKLYKKSSQKRVKKLNVDTNIALICLYYTNTQMNYKILPLFMFCLGVVSISFAATEKISGEIIDDLYFSDAVKISGIDYPDDMGDTKGTSTVEILGEGSVTIGARSGGGFPRIVLWGGTKIESEREWIQDVTHKEWWSGTMGVPTVGRLVKSSELKFDIEGNHSSSELVVLETFVFGRNDSTVAETFKFSPAATVVLPVNVPNFTKLWVAYRDGPDMEDIEEESFCVVQNQLCIIDVSAANEISLVREKYERCPVDEIDNGVVGDTPYCQYTCEKGFVYNDDLTGCVANGDGEALDIAEVMGEEDPTKMNEVESGGNGILAGPARQGYLRYTGTNVQTTKVDTEGMKGDELQRSLRHNITVDSRTGGREVANDSMLEELGDAQWSLWRWAHREEANVLPEGQADSRGVAISETINEAGGEEPMHTSAPLLPSTGPAGIFVGISALGFGLMTYSRRRRR